MAVICAEPSCIWNMLLKLATAGKIQKKSKIVKLIHSNNIFTESLSCSFQMYYSYHFDGACYFRDSPCSLYSLNNMNILQSSSFFANKPEGK